MLTDAAPPGWRLPSHRHRDVAPAGMEAFFEALAGVDDPAAMAELATRHGWRFG